MIPSQAESIIIGGLLGALVSLVIMPLVQRAVPAEWWVEFHSIEVVDAEPGVCPRLSVDRTIWRDVSGSWSVQVLRWDEAVQSWRAAAPTGHGSDNYRTTDQLPEPLWLSWWLGDANDPAGCPWSVSGLYQLDQSWTFMPWFFRPRRVEWITDYEVEEG